MAPAYSSQNLTTDMDAVGTVSVPSEAASLSQSQLEMMRAFFCYEFEVSQLDRDTVPAATPEAVEEWIEALGMSGLFAPAELRTMSAAWLSEPDALVSLLVGNIDEVAAKREVVDVEPESGNTPSFLRAS